MIIRRSVTSKQKGKITSGQITEEFWKQQQQKKIPGVGPKLRHSEEGYSRRVGKKGSYLSKRRN